MSIPGESEIHSLFMDFIRAFYVMFEEARNAKQQDQLLRQVIKYNRTRWSTNVFGGLQRFYQRRNSLSIVNGCILYYERVAVPQKLQARVLRQFHTGHPGINRMKALARNYLYWPHMNKQLEQLASMKATLKAWPVPRALWSRVHIDYAGSINGQNNLIALDTYNRWPEVILKRFGHYSADLAVPKLW
ncbi:unnamed protein product [Dibothriocephalus latus]|uniref:Integrase zinc-binding domain-containing protein n=1 Tax=Dibothriocephalus latus TaxID=60516 RepID=A0A3P7L8Z5_DIBLA|nr:unnamed protein product [Dibothriocephalus latus]